MSDWHRQVPTAGTVELPPDPRALDALGRNHSLETALADLVDNSIDATATHVLIRFVQHGPRLVGLYVVDNGQGIAPDAIDAAMTVGGRRAYAETDLGRFGLGLKAASFSQAGSLTVLSQAADAYAVGRRWLLTGDREGFHCDRVPSDFAAAELRRGWPIPTAASGTVVRWDDVSAFPAFDDREHSDEFLSRTISHLQGHLGLMFHRILGDGRVQIWIDVEDVGRGVGVVNTVSALDPFGYPRAVAGWPKTLVADLNGVRVALRCHIWPGRSNLPEYRLPGGAEQRQGIYFYRRDRLLHAGGWEGVHAPDKKLQLARVAVDIDGDVCGLFVMNPEKSRVSAGPHFAQMISSARAADGTTIGDYLQAAEAIWVKANQRVTAQRTAVLPPGRGLHPQVCREIRDELPQRNDKPLNILWKPFAGDDFFEIDRAAGTLWINHTYRRALLGGRRGGLNDLPLIKALLFLLTEQMFEGSHLGPRDKDNIELWREILTAAAKAEKTTYEARA
ncbi:MAG TPA: ATP-binding protein [Micromonosporaceae bacterium]|nr:ATP-binding protein [Micromonosporaceae bacterium]